MNCGEPVRSRLVVKEMDGEKLSINEAVLHVQGILTMKELPPLDEKPQYV